MTLRRLLWLNLRHHWRGNLAVLLGVVVGTAVLTGALFVGDSLRGSLRDLANEQIGWIEHALVGGRFFRQELAENLEIKAVSFGAGNKAHEESFPVVPAIVLQGSLSRKTASSGLDEPEQATRRAGRVTIWGVDAEFCIQKMADRPRRRGWLPWRREADEFAAILSNLDSTIAWSDWANADRIILGAALARELDVNEGDTITLSLGKVSSVPRETLLGRREAGDAVAELPIKVGPWLAAGDFENRVNLHPSPTTARNAFVPLRWLQEKLGQKGRVNALLSRSRPDDPQPKLNKALTFDDWGLQLQTPSARVRNLDRNRDGRLTRNELQRGGEHFVRAADANKDGKLEEVEVRAYYEKQRPYLSLESRNMLLEPAVVDAALVAAKEMKLRASPTLVYLANRISDGKGDLPYSVVAALDPSERFPLGPFLPGGVSDLRDDEIILADWKDSPLKAKPGDEITLSYFLPEDQGGLRETTSRFRLRGVIPLQGVAADPDLTPEFPGITDKLTIADWNPPFPYDNKRIQKRDEQFWDEHRTTPKAYVSLHTGRELWGSRFGNVTSIRLAASEGADLDKIAKEFESKLLAHLKPEQGGFVFENVRERALEAGPGGFDFGGLFLGFSVFLIAAALLLIGLLFRLNLDHRAKEIGLLLATGYRRETAGWLLLLEGGILALVGGVLGCVGAVGYAWLLLEFLRAWWPGGLEGSFLRLHVGGMSLLIGYGSAVLVSVLTVLWAVRVIGKAAPSALLAGQLATNESAADESKPGWSRWVALTCGVLGIGLIVMGNWVHDHEAQAGTFFGGGALLLTAGLAGAALWLRSQQRQTVGGHGAPALAQLGRRNAARHRTRSLLTAGLLAAAAFLVVAVESFRREPSRDFLEKEGGSGGYSLYAESDLPIFQDLNSADGRAELNFPDRAQAQLQGIEFRSLRLRAGDDASCLNLANPRKPRLLGVPGGLVRDGGFRFADTQATSSEERANPWLLLQQQQTDSAIPVFGEKNSVAWMLKSSLGGKVEVTNERGELVKLRIVGLLQDSVFQSGLLMSEENFLRLYPSHSGYHVFLVRTPTDRLDEAKALLEKTLAPQGFEASRSTERLAMYLAVENTYLSTFQMLGGLGLLLGALGLAVVLLRGVWERRGELALLRALGFRPGALGWLVLAENGFLLLLGLGVGTVSALLAVLPHVLAGGGAVPWLRLTGLLAMVLVVGFVAGAAAVAASLRAPLLPALRRD